MTTQHLFGLAIHFAVIMFAIIVAIRKGDSIPRTIVAYTVALYAVTLITYGFSHLAGWESTYFIKQRSQMEFAKTVLSIPLWLVGL